MSDGTEKSKAEYDADEWRRKQNYARQLLDKSDLRNDTTKIRMLEGFAGAGYETVEATAVEVWPGRNKWTAENAVRGRVEEAVINAMEKLQWKTREPEADELFIEAARILGNRKRGIRTGQTPPGTSSAASR